MGGLAGEVQAVGVGCAGCVVGDHVMGWVRGGEVRRAGSESWVMPGEPWMSDKRWFLWGGEVGGRRVMGRLGVYKSRVRRGCLLYMFM